MHLSDPHPGVRVARRDDLCCALQLIEAILQSHSYRLADDLVPYRNHASRVFLHCCTLLRHAEMDSPEQIQRASIVAAFHDLGIWTAGTFDYIGPSCLLAREYLRETGRPEWTAEVEAAIVFHHKITPARGRGALVDCFRRADWTDVTRIAGFGVSAKHVAAARRQFPYEGFHRRLLHFAWKRFKQAPWSPLPMMKW